MLLQMAYFILLRLSNIPLCVSITSLQVYLSETFIGVYCVRLLYTKVN